jgi:hypothetical protein
MDEHFTPEERSNVTPIGLKQMAEALPEASTSMMLPEMLECIRNQINMMALVIERHPDEALRSADAQLRGLHSAAGFLMSRIVRLYGWSQHFDDIPQPDDRVLRSRMYPAPKE